MAALMNVAHRNRTASRFQAWMASSLHKQDREVRNVFQPNAAFQDHWTLRLYKDLRNKCNTFMICKPQNCCTNFSFPICEICPRKLYQIVFLRVETQLMCISADRSSSFSSVVSIKVTLTSWLLRFIGWNGGAVTDSLGRKKIVSLANVLTCC